MNQKGPDRWIKDRNKDTKIRDTRAYWRKGTWNVRGLKNVKEEFNEEQELNKEFDKIYIEILVIIENKKNRKYRYKHERVSGIRMHNKSKMKK